MRLSEHAVNQVSSLDSKFKVSILILAYKMEQTIVQALDSALAQTVPCEIIVSDDASGDGTVELAAARAASYQGQHRVIVRRNETNQGLCPHIDTVAQLASGAILVFLAGDDIAYPYRVERLLAMFDVHADAYAVGSSVDEIDEQGALLKRNTRFMDSPMTQRDFLYCGKFATLLGAAMALRRELIIGLPPLQGMVEDNMLTLRASLFGDVYCLKEPLLQYRLHQSNLNAWVYSRQGSDARRRRYERTIRMYREIADDHARCLAALPQLSAERRAIGEKIVSMYRLEAAGREALLNQPKRNWLSPIWRGLMHPGLRRKSLERALKLMLPRKWLGL